jgi:hypothetical protein
VTTPGPLDVLARIRAGRPTPAGERCELCGEPVADAHQHVVSVRARSLLCTCRACYLLFDHDGAALAYRAVPDRHLAFPSATLRPQQWDALGIPVGVAFFFVNSDLGRTVALYPGPAGATESELPLEEWRQIVEENPELAAVRPDVEAVVVRRRGDQFDCFGVPIDACYELVGQLRTAWRGFDGGQQARRLLDDFFTRVAERARPASRGGAA